MLQAFDLLFPSQFAIQKPLPFTLVRVFHGTVIIQIEDLTGIDFYPEVEPPYVQRAARGCDRRMRGPHIAGVFSAACEVAPLGQGLDHKIGLLLPDKAVGTTRGLLTGGRRIEYNLDKLVVKVD